MKEDVNTVSENEIKVQSLKADDELPGEDISDLKCNEDLQCNQSKENNRKEREKVKESPEDIAREVVSTKVIVSCPSNCRSE